MSIVQRGLLLLFGIGLGLLGAELAMIVFEPWLSRGFYVYDAEIGFRVRPHARGSNHLGFNDEERPFAKPAGTYRVLVLGDSFNWVGGVHDNYVAVARRVVRAAFPDRAIEVLNVGYPMTHTGEQLELLRKVGLRYEPDLVVLGFYVGNDFLDGDPFRKRIVVNGMFIDIDPREELVVLGYPILPKSRLFEFVRQRLKMLREQARSAGDAAGPPADLPDLEVPREALPPDALPPDPFGERHRAVSLARLARTVPPDTSGPTFSTETYLGIERARIRMCSRDPRQRALFTPRIEYILGRIAAMSDLLGERGVRLLVAIFPDEYQVDAALLEAAVAGAGRRPADFEPLCPQRILREFLDARGLASLDLQPLLRDAHAIRPAFLLRNSHWNRFGVEVVGRALGQFLIPILHQELRARAASAASPGRRGREAPDGV